MRKNQSKSNSNKTSPPPIFFRKWANTGNIRTRRSSQIVVTSANDHEKLYATLTRSLNSKLLARPVSFDLPKKSRLRPIGYDLGGEQSLYGIFCRIKVVADSTSSCYQLTDVYSTPSPPILYQRTNIFF